LPNFKSADKGRRARSLAFFQDYSLCREPPEQADSCACRDPFLRQPVLSLSAELSGTFPVNFASDNNAAIAPGILSALNRANEGFALGYGNDALTR
jgi:hypothetical protein